LFYLSILLTIFLFANCAADETWLKTASNINKTSQKIEDISKICKYMQLKLKNLY